MQLEQFATDRGFTVDEFEEFGLYIADDHLWIPIRAGDHEWYERRRCFSPERCCPAKYIGPKGEPLHLYNPLGLGPHSPEVWIAEGELDTLSLIVAGAPALGILGNNGFNQAWRLLFEAAEIVIALDPDDAGNAAAEKLMDQWPARQVSRFDPSPYGDLNEWLVDDREGFIEAVNAW